MSSYWDEILIWGIVSMVIYFSVGIDGLLCFSCGIGVCTYQDVKKINKNRG